MIIPIVPEDLFELNGSHRIVYDNDNRVVIVDNWYKNFSQIQEVLSNMPAIRWKWTEGSRNFIDYYDCRPIIPFHYETEKIYTGVEKITNIIFDYFQVDEVELENNFYEFNFYKNIKAGVSNSLQHFPHVDQSYNCLIYLDSVASGGTALYSAPLMMNEEDENLLYDVSNIPKTIIEAKPNRMVLFDGRRLHGGYVADHDAYVNDWRMNQVMFFRRV